jgi:hypothetical protein
MSDTKNAQLGEDGKQPEVIENVKQPEVTETEKPPDKTGNGDVIQGPMDEMFHMYFGMPPAEQKQFFAMIQAASQASKGESTSAGEASIVNDSSASAKKAVKGQLASTSGTPASAKQTVDPPYTSVVHTLGKFEIPRLLTFSGDRNNKGDASYAQWRYEVMCLESDPTWSSGAILQSIRRSTRGMAASVLQSLGMHANISQIISKFDMLFGNVHSGEELLKIFFMAEQSVSETVVEWGCRLEELSRQAQEKGMMAAAEVEKHMREQFWRGLCSTYIRTNTRYLFNSESTYKELMLAARSIELEEKKTFAKPVKSQQMVTCDDSSASAMGSKLDSILQKLTLMDARIQQLESERTSHGKSSSMQGDGCCYQCGGDDHWRDRCPELEETRKRRRRKPNRQAAPQQRDEKTSQMHPQASGRKQSKALND